MCFCCFYFFYCYAVKVKKFGSDTYFDPLDQVNLRCFSHMSSKLIKEKYSGYILSIFMCFCCFYFFQENYPHAVKVKKFGSHSYFDPLDQVNLRCFCHMSSELIKEKYSGYILSIFMCFCCFYFFQENYPYAVKVKKFGSDTYFDPLDQVNLRCFDTCHQS